MSFIPQEGDLIRITSKNKGHPSWTGRLGIVVSYNGPGDALVGSWNCEMIPPTGGGTLAVIVHWFLEEMELVKSHKDLVVEVLGDNYE